MAEKQQNLQHLQFGFKPLTRWVTRSVEKSKPKTCCHTDSEKKVDLDQPHPKETCQQYHYSGSDLESTGKEEEGKIWHRDSKGGQNSSVGSAWARCHSVAGSIHLWGHFPVEGIFPLELTWVQTPFPPKTPSDESINRGLVCAHMHFIART